jgi:hypothetical protein
VSSGSNAEVLREVARRTGAIFGEIIEGATMDVLGVRVDTVRKTVRLAEKFMNRHGDLLRETIYRENFFDNISFLQLWRVLGVLFRHVEVARRPMADSFALIQRIRKIARKLAIGDAKWTDPATMQSAEKHQLRQLAKETLRGDEYDVLDAEEAGPSANDDILFTDASMKGLGYVWITKRKITVGNWPLSPKQAEQPIHELEAEALLRGLQQTRPNRRTIIFIDSQVLFHGLSKGRSNALVVNRAAGAVACRPTATWVGWIPSESNWADGPSRMREMEPSDYVLSHLAPVRQWHTVPRAPP